MKKCGTFAPKIMAKLAELVLSWDWKKDGGQFIPYPATWINRGGWEDEVGTAIAAPQTRAELARAATDKVTDAEYQDDSAFRR